MREPFYKLLTLLFPQRMVCHGCGLPLHKREGLLCSSCAKALSEYAFPVEGAPALPGVYVGFAASAYAYQGTAARLIKALKFQADYTAAEPLAEGMAVLYAALPQLRQAQVCTAVPVHPKRLRRRGYNQAEVLAKTFAQLTGVAVQTHVLMRRHHRHSQVGQGREERLRNINNAFVVVPDAAAQIVGKTILLIDDVYTTGATSEECAKVLVKAGANSVTVLTACRA